MRLTVLPLIFLVCFWIGCDFLLIEYEPHSQVGLDLGNTYTYRWTLTETSPTGLVETIGTDTFSVRVSAVGEQIGTYSGLIRIDVFETGIDTFTFSTWYSETPTEVLNVAHRSAGVLPTVHHKKSGWDRANDLFFHPWLMRDLGAGMDPSDVHALDDSIIVRTDPRLVYDLPLEVGRTWTSFTFPFVQNREVVSEDTLEVESGVFPCYRIITAIPDIAPDLVWVDFVSREGLLLRIVERTRTRYDAQGNPIGDYRSQERIEAISISQKGNIVFPVPV